MSIDVEKNILKTHLINWTDFDKYRKDNQSPITKVLQDFEKEEIQDQLEDLIHCIILSELKLRYKIPQEDIDLAFDVYESENLATMVYAMYLFERNYVWTQLFNFSYNDVEKHEVRSNQLRDLFKHQLFITAKLLDKDKEIFKLIGFQGTSDLADKIQETHMIAEQWNLMNFMYQVHEVLEGEDSAWGENPFKQSDRNARRFNRDNQ
tara:strand:+ start:863 stop:1483 length:621 start_codon:yes stop_codon:yes gene_type:complete